jgi:magnesium-protoporphyrin IX monomethyl ester (oxidative) cyclase
MDNASAFSYDEVARRPHRLEAAPMKVLLVHPGVLMYSEIFLRLEPLGLERVAEAVRGAGHDVCVLDLQVFRQADYFRLLDEYAPGAVGFSLNYLANVPEVIDLARETRRRRPDCFLFVGGHSASFIADELLDHAQGALDCVVRGEGEEITPRVLAAARDGGLETLPGVVTSLGSGPQPKLIHRLEAYPPARDLLPRRNKYFIGMLDPCASVEFTRGCPWNCSFCSAWTFYGRSYRRLAPEAAAEDLARVAEPNVFLVDDVAFIQPEFGMAIADQVERRRIRKRYYLETRCDVLLRNEEVFRRWARLGLEYMFLGLEAIDEEGLKLYRKRVSLSDNFRALEVARALGIQVAINLIADPAWDADRFRVIREWALSVPEIVHLTVNTPYPGTETWYSDGRALTSLDYRLFDIQHAVLPTALPLKRFYAELVNTQFVLHRKHLGFSFLRRFLPTTAGLLARGQTNFLEGLWKFGQVHSADRQYYDHMRDVRYTLRPPDPALPTPPAADLYVHNQLAEARAGRT